MRALFNIKAVCILPLMALCLYSCTTPYEPDINTPRSQSRSSKRGVSFSFAQFPDIDAALLGPSISWFYNWGNTVIESVDAALIQSYDVDYCPMVWNGNYNEANIRAYVANHPECKYLLGFNEPNLTDQANMTPEQAAALWPNVKQLADELGLKLVSPALNYGTLAGYNDPIKWLDEFIALVPDNGIEVIALHCYMGGAGGMKSFIEKFRKYGKPIWLTEFCPWNGSGESVNSQIAYMSAALPYLEKDPLVERYAWFIPRYYGYPYMALISEYELSDVGKVFVNMTTMDQKWYALQNQKVEAEHYTNSNVEECIGTNNLVQQVSMRITTDSEGGNLDVVTFTSGKWLEYQFELTKDAEYKLEMRHNTLTNSEMQIFIDGEQASTISIAATAVNQWTNSEFPINLTKGKHIVRLVPTSGNISFNWLRIN